MRTWSIGLLVGAGLCLPLAGADKATEAREALHLSCAQKDCLRLEPILVSVRLQGAPLAGLPAAPDQGKASTFSFEITPAVKPRPKAKALPLEARLGH